MLWSVTTVAVSSVPITVGRCMRACLSVSGTGGETAARLPLLRLRSSRQSQVSFIRTSPPTRTPVSSPFKPVAIPSEPLHVTVLKEVAREAAANPTKPAFIDAGNNSVQCTFADFWLECATVAGWLKSRGFGRGDVAAIVLHNCWQYGSFSLATNIAGGASSGASALSTDYELERQFRDSHCKMVLTSVQNLNKVLVAAKRSPTVNTIIVIGETNGELPFGVVPWKKVREAAVDPIAPSSAGIDVDNDCCVLPYSSGTTGPPKGVVLSHKALNTILEIYKQHNHGHVYNHLTPPHVPEKHPGLLMLPFYHVYGYSLFLIGLLNRQTNVVMSKFEPEVFLRSIQKFKPQMLMAVPPIIVFMAKHPIVDKYDISSLQYIGSGAAPLGKDTIDDLQRRHPSITYVTQGYGMTEMALACALPTLGGKSAAKHGSCGRIASNCEVKIVNVTTGEEQPLGERGELWVKTPARMVGYLNRPDATNETIDADGWLRTGDVAYVDSDADLFVVDRVKELIKVKGLQVPPAELEDVLLSHSQISDAAVIGVPDTRFGELPHAFIVRTTDKLTEEDVMKWVAERVAPYKQLAGGVKFIKEIPKSAAGKILRRQLRDLI